MHILLLLAVALFQLALTHLVAASPCDAVSCKLPSCTCPSVNPPGGIAALDAPQFVTLTFDDAIQPASYQIATDLLNLKNPNGCPAKGTWFATVQYGDPSLAQQWYAAGNEVAAHTFNHIGDPSEAEIVAGKLALVKYGGIPRGKLNGFRSPFLNFTVNTIDILYKDSFLYDSSATALKDDAFWPYTLDHGFANGCWDGLCAKTVKAPGFWEIPMHAVLDDVGTAHLMDPYLDGNATVVQSWIRSNFDRHYNGGRAPFGIYIHPIHLVAATSQSNETSSQLAMLKEAIAYMASHPDVHFVTNQQLLRYMTQPVNKALLGQQDYMLCPAVNVSTEICNGRSDIGPVGSKIDQGLLETCNFPTAAWSTCYGCPSTEPTVDNPTPVARSVDGSPGYRSPAPENCDPLYWSPTENKCYCTTEACKYAESSPPLSMPAKESTSSLGHASSGSTISSPSTGLTAFAAAVALFALL